MSYIDELVEKTDVRSYIYVEFAKILHDYLSGRFEKYESINLPLVESCLKIGETLYTSYYVNMHVLSNLEFGKYDEVISLVKILDETGDKFNHHYAKGLRYFAITKLLMKHGDLDLALKESDRDINFLKLIEDVTHMPRSYAIRAQVQIRMGDLEGAMESIRSAKELKLEIPVPLYTYEMLVSELVYEVCKLEKSILGKSNDIKTQKRQVKDCLKRAMRISKKVMPCKPEVLLQGGIYYWLIDDKKKAQKFWTEAIELARTQGARINLSRVYMEIGNRLSDDSSELKGIDGPGYIEESKTIFEELDEHWNMPELEGIIQSE